MDTAPIPAFARDPHPSPVPASERDGMLADPGFGRVFTDHMAIVRYTEGTGWHDAKITARGPIAMDPATAVLHYAQEIFEGLKAYHLPDGGAALFRPEMNARRFNDSAARLAMPALPEELFVGSLEALVEADRAWIPNTDGGALYLRPFMFASEVFLGVKPSSEYLYLVIASSVGAYFKSGVPAVSLWVSEIIPAPRRGGRAPPSAAATMPPAWSRRRKRSATAATRWCSSMRWRTAGWRSWVA